MKHYTSDKSHYIPIPLSNRIEDHTKWINNSRVKKVNVYTHPAKLLQLDFKSIKHLKPYHIAPLACIIHEYITKGYRIKFVNENEQVKKYLDSFNFKQLLNNDPDSNSFPTINRPDTFPIWRIEQKASNIYPSHVQSYFEKNNFKGKDLFELGTSLGELMNNVFDHSKSKIPGYTFTQFDTKRNELITSVCDFGIGIPKRINEYLKLNKQKAVSSIESIKMAIQYEFSTKSQPRNRGFGLDNVITNVKSLYGKILIVSGNAIYWHRSIDNVEAIEMSDHFPGCLIVIYLNTDKLRYKEKELSDELQIL